MDGHMRKLKAAATAYLLGMAWVGSVAMAASGFTVSPGNWVVTDEVNGQPGRGMGIEVRDGTLVMAVYNYTPTGQATFHLTAGAMNGNSFSGQLMEYKGGRYFGGPALDAVETGSAGAVELQFTNATRGTIKFPGEQAKAISRFQFDGLQPTQFLRKDFLEYWFVAELDADNKPTSAYPLIITDDAQGLRTNKGACQNAVVDGSITFSCRTGWQAPDSYADVSFQRFDRQLEGSVTRSFSAGKRRLVGVRMAAGNVGPNTRPQYDTPTTGWADPAKSYSVPQSGMWIINSENTGRPGRGLSLDLQASTLVVQVYAYEADGSPTFRIGSGSYVEGESSVPLMKVRGGRHYGGGAQSGVDAGSDGNAQIRFTSPTTGQIRLPGEQWTDMQKFSVGADAPAAESLLGQWLVWNEGEFSSYISTVLNLTRVENGRATDDAGAARCWFESTPQGTVRCQGPRDEYRFTPSYGNGTSVGQAMNDDHDQIVVWRIKDRYGVAAGALSKP
jgi:hypothetical protein